MRLNCSTYILNKFMIVQITMTRNECFLLKEQLPIWSKYADGFIFFNDDSTDDTVEFLEKNKEKYNILAILNRPDDIVNVLKQESDVRQSLYDEALKYSKKIICLDSDEYLDGSMTKEELNQLLDTNAGTVFYLQWVQYASKNTLRVDTSWNYNVTDRVASYSQRGVFPYRQMHSLHLPPAERGVVIPTANLFIAHLQWLDKRWVGVKQYFWKVTDYVNKKLHNADVVGAEAYDNSVNNFNWEYRQAPIELKIREDIFKIQDMKQNDRLKFIVKYTNMYDIPNLNDWGMSIYDYAIKQKSK